MNILITNDDGPNSLGLAILRQKLKQRYKEAKMVTIASDQENMGRSCSLTLIPQPTKMDDIAIEEAAKQFYIVKGASPLDIVRIAYRFPERFLTTGQFDTVISGVNVGANIGLDVFTSGTTMPVAYASMAYGWAGMALSQAYPNFQENGANPGEGQEMFFANAEKALAEVLIAYHPEPGECFNVNFPPTGHTLKGISTTPVANHSRWYMDPSTLPPGMECDIHRLNQGFITLSELELRINPTLR